MSAFEIERFCFIQDVKKRHGRVGDRNFALSSLHNFLSFCALLMKVLNGTFKNFPE